MRQPLERYDAEVHENLEIGGGSEPARSSLSPAAFQGLSVLSGHRETAQSSEKSGYYYTSP
jgi:hypothetical protein